MFWNGFFEMPDEYIMVEHAVDRPLEEPYVCVGTYRWIGCTIGVSQIGVCGGVVIDK